MQVCGRVGKILKQLASTIDGEDTRSVLGGVRQLTHFKNHLDHLK